MREKEGEHKCAIHLHCFCCWNLQLSWSFGSGEGTFAGIVAIAVKMAGQRAECREFLNFCHFHASTFCVICLWRREETGGWCLALFECGQQGLFVVVDCSCWRKRKCSAACSDVAKQKGKIVDD